MGSENARGDRKHFRPMHTREASCESAGRPLDTSKGHILVVDDEPFVGRMVKKLLERRGYQVSVCGDGVEGLAFYHENRGEVDLILLDMVMPHLDGPGLFNAVRKLDPEVRVLLCSGYSVHDQAEALLHAGAVGFLQKPFRMQELLDAVASALDS